MHHPETRHLSYPKSIKYLYIGFLVLIGNSGFLAAFYHANLFYYFNVFLHISLGIILIAPFILWARRFLKYDAHHGKPFGHNAGRMGYLMMIIAAGTGIYLVIVKNLYPNRWILYLHIAFGILACLFMISSIRRAGYNISVDNLYSYAGRWGLVVFISAGMLPVFTWTLRTVFPNRNNYIGNTVALPMNLAEAAMNGSSGPFYPSPVATTNQKILNQDFLVDSKRCGQSGCHPDILKQWQSSLHRHSSLNNPLYRSAVGYLQQFEQPTAANYCAGCHSPALLVSGQASEPVDELVRQNTGDGSVGCTSCHAIVKVKNTMGNGSYVLERPSLASLALSPLKWLRNGYSWLVQMAPQPHKQFFLRPFLKDQPNAFCSTCHKISLEKPEFMDHWSGGLNYYDSWQLTSFGGSDVFSFFKPNKRTSCVDCHMPLVASKDAGNRNGKVHDHRFRPKVGAVFSNHYSQSGKDYSRIVSVDLFAYPKKLFNFTKQNILAASKPDSARESSNLEGISRNIAPLERARPIMTNSDSIGIDIVLRSKNVGHFLPYGTFETKTIWLDFGLFDESGQKIFTKKFNRSFQVSGQPQSSSQKAPSHFSPGNFKKMNHDSLPSLNSIPAEAALVERVFIPARKFFNGPTTARATLYLQPGIMRNPLTRATQTNSESNQQSLNKELPQGKDLVKKMAEKPGMAVNPIVLCQKKVRINAVTNPYPANQDGLSSESDKDRWNAYGAGLFLRGDYDFAASAFKKVTELAPSYINGWINLARAYLQTGEIDSAQAILNKALQMDADQPQAHFYVGVYFKEKQKYSLALKHFKMARRQLPEDIFLLLQIGHIHFLQKQYKMAIRIFRQVILKYPENLPAHYYRMVSYKGLGRYDKAKIEAELYFKYSRAAKNGSPAEPPDLIFYQLPKMYQHFRLPDIPWQGPRKMTDK